MCTSVSSWCSVFNEFKSNPIFCQELSYSWCCIISFALRSCCYLVHAYTYHKLLYVIWHSYFLLPQASMRDRTCVLSSLSLSLSLPLSWNCYVDCYVSAALMVHCWLCSHSCVSKRAVRLMLQPTTPAMLPLPSGSWAAVIDYCIITERPHGTSVPVSSLTLSSGVPLRLLPPWVSLLLTLGMHALRGLWCTWFVSVSVGLSILSVRLSVTTFCVTTRNETTKQ